MALLDHFTPDAEDNGFTRYGIEDFVSLFNYWETGATGFDKQRIIDFFGMSINPTPDADELQLDEMKAVIDGISQPFDRLEWLLTRLRQPLVNLETGLLDMADTKALIGLA